MSDHSSVHVNRLLNSLEDGLIKRHKRQIAIVDWSAIHRTADFNKRYLHFDQIAA